MAQLPAFTLEDASGHPRAFPTGRTTLLAFVKEDCPTCGLSMPLIEEAHTAFGGAVDVLAVGQDADGERRPRGAARPDRSDAGRFRPQGLVRV